MSIKTTSPILIMILLLISCSSEDTSISEISENQELTQEINTPSNEEPE